MLNSEIFRLILSCLIRKSLLYSTRKKRNVNSRLTFQTIILTILTIKIFFKVNHGASKSLDEVLDSVKKNKVCLKGVINVPEV